MRPRQVGAGGQYRSHSVHSAPSVPPSPPASYRAASRRLLECMQTNTRVAELE